MTYQIIDRRGFRSAYAAWPVATFILEECHPSRLPMRKADVLEHRYDARGCALMRWQGCTVGKGEGAVHGQAASDRGAKSSH